VRWSWNGWIKMPPPRGRGRRTADRHASLAADYDAWYDRYPFAYETEVAVQRASRVFRLST